MMHFLSPALIGASFLVSMAGLPDNALGQEPITIDSVAVRYASEVRLPATTSGRIADVMVRLNQGVRQGDPLVRLDGEKLSIERRAAHLRLEKARRDAASLDRVEYARIALQEAEAEFEDAKGIQRDARGAIASTRLRALRLAIERSKLGLVEAQRSSEQATSDVDLRQAEIDVLDARIASLRVDAPINSVAIQIHHAPGEWVTEGATVVTLGEVAKLRVDALIDLSRAVPAELVGRKISVLWLDPATGRNRMLQGFVESVDPDLLGGKQFRLRGVIENELETIRPSMPGAPRRAAWTLRPGTKVQLRIESEYAVLESKPLLSRRGSEVTRDASTGAVRK